LRFFASARNLSIDPRIFLMLSAMPHIQSPRQILHSHRKRTTSRCPVADVYVYDFLAFATHSVPESRLGCAATLIAIEKFGTAIMESQRAVDGSEIDSDGFLVSNTRLGSHRSRSMAAAITSLELRAASRDRLAQQMHVGSDGPAIYMLRLESRHLRREAQFLTIEHDELLRREAFQASPLTECVASAALLA
jgi:hypothetical protein